MKSAPWNKLSICGVSLAVFCSVLVIIEHAQASSSGFSWTMNLREVDGYKNRQVRHLEGGTLTLEGKIWIHEKIRTANPTPEQVRIEVFRDEFGKDPSICSVLVRPSTILNDKRDFSRGCGRVETGNYYLVIAKPHGKDDVDGWHNQGSGSITTK